MKILITGGAGFIGYHLIQYLLSFNEDVSIVNIDNLNDYYDVDLKKSRLEQLNKWSSNRYVFKKIDIADKIAINELFEEYSVDFVVNLAAQAGVRYSKIAPDTYIHSNVMGFYTLIDAAAKHNVKRFIYASSSSVYGATTNFPFKETQAIDTPMSLYAATKVSNEALASSYYYSYNLETVGLRFFNVYGAWGRPDMAYFKWTEAIYKGEDVEIRGGGELFRDMTYVGDVVKAIGKLLDVKNIHSRPLVVNVGNSSPVKIKDVLNYIIYEMDKRGLKGKFNKIFTEKGPEEPEKTWADTKLLKELIHYTPETSYKDGLSYFIDWYEEFYVKD